MTDIHYIDSEPWETQKDWEKIVCQAVLDYPMTPRQAKRILEIVGRIQVTTAMPIERILVLAFNQPIFWIME